MRESSPPARLQANPQWVLWKYQTRNGKTTKPPYQRNGRFAATNNPETWCTYEQTTEALEAPDSEFNGRGYVFGKSDGLTGIDIDHCILANGEIAEWAIPLTQRFYPTYIERSPSGGGLHIICLGKALATGARKWKDETGQEVGIEVYDYTSPRYFTVTGDVVAGTEPADCQDALEWLYQLYFADEDEPPTETKTGGLKHLPPDIIAVQGALRVIPPDEYTDWLKVGMALKSAGFPVELWDEWSQQSDKYEPGVCAKKWETFKSNGCSIGTVFYLAKQYAPDRLNHQEQPDEVRDFPPGAADNVVDINVNRQPAADEPGSEPTEDPPALAAAADQPKSIFKQPRNINESEHPRWLKQPIPWGYRLTDAPGGILKVSEEKPSGDRISGPLYVAARTAAPGGGGNAGLILEFETIDGELTSLAIPRTRLHEDPCILARDLSNQGFSIVPGREKELLKFIEASRPDEVRFSVTQTGWAKSTDRDQLVYVLPHSATAPGYHFQPERHSPSSQSMRSSGTLRDWVDNVLSLDPYPLFVVLVSLCGPLLKPAQLDSGGFHLYGGSSSGKTTLAQIAASVWGNGADPADAPEHPYTKRWNATLNAMEGLAASANDMTLILDELGSCNSKDFGRAIYDLAGGQGKSAMDASRQLRIQRSWRISILSTGELSSAAKVEEGAIGAGKKGIAVIKAGQMIRLIDIEMKPATFQASGNLNARQVVDRLKRNCALYYGTLGPAFIQALCERFTADELRETVQNSFETVMARLTAIKKDASSVEQRALRRFALAEVAGHMLIYLGILPKRAITTEAVRHSITTVVNDWLPISGALPDAERAVIALREFILSNQDLRFKKLREAVESDKLNREIAGYYDPIKDTYYVLPAAFREATGFNPKAAAKLLADQRLLEMDRPDRLLGRTTINGKQISCYGVRGKLLDESGDD